ncbi:MAG: hypothetical protein ACE5GU_02460 [Candidatus Scalinduaceae bacterium]
MRRGYKVSLVTDAIKGVNEEGKTGALNEMKDAGAFFTTTEDIIAKQTLTKKMSIQ